MIPNQDIAARICKALGVPGHCVAMTIRMRVGHLVTVETEHYLPREMAESLARSLSRGTTFSSNGWTTGLR